MLMFFFFERMNRIKEKTNIIFINLTNSDPSVVVRNDLTIRTMTHSIKN